MTADVHGHTHPSVLLGARYRALRPLGEGARKRVTLVHDEWLDRDVVAYEAKENGDEGSAAALRREAAVLARLGSCPHVLTVHDLVDAGGPVMICQYVPGGSLLELLRGRPALDISRAVAVAVDVATALDATHRAGVVHRDVKPGNIWLDADGRAVLGDFGLAVEAGAPPAALDVLVGTAPYAAPEQLLGDGSDARSDLYSLGAVLYELLTGHPPFQDAVTLGLVAKALQEVPPPPSVRRPDVPAALDDLVLRLLARQPAERPDSASQVLAALRNLDVATSTTPSWNGFVGRAQELAQLELTLSEAAAGRGTTTIVLGEPGVGKTRTAVELAHRARQGGWTVLTGRAPDDVAPSFWPWIQVLQSVVRSLDPEDLPGSDDRRLLAALLPQLSPAEGEPSPTPGESTRILVFDAVVRMLRRVAAVRPVLVLLDDMHWADPDSVALTVHLARELAGDRMALVLCARAPEDDDGIAATVERLAAVAGRTVSLRGLSVAETGRYLESALSVRPDRLLLQELHDRTDGNPFHVAELVRLLQTEHSLSAKGLTAVEQVAPTGVREVLHRRLRSVPDDCHQLLQSMSVLGREAMPQVLAAVSDREPGAVLDLLDLAVSARLVVRVPGSPSRFRFAHALVRETLYEGLSPARRAELHRRAVAALVAAFPHEREAPAAEIAHHAVRAAVDGEPAPAVLWSLRAARAAAIACAHEDAVLHHGRAVDLARELPPAASGGELPSFGDLLLELGEAQRTLGQTEQAKLTFLRAAGEALSQEDGELLARAAIGYGLGLGGFGYVERADGVLISLLEEALAALGDQDTALRVRVLARLSTELHFTPFRRRRLVLSQEAVEVAHRLGDPVCELVAAYSRTLALLGPDALEEQRRTAERVVWLAGEQWDPDMAFRGHHLRLMVALETGAREQARAQVRACRRIADAQQQPSHHWHASVFEAMLALARGEHDEALRRADAALQAGARGSAGMARVMHGAQVLVAHWAQGRLESLLPAVAEFADDYPHAPAWRATLAFCLTETGHLDEARVQLEALASRDFADLPEDGNYLTTAALLAHVAARLGDVTRARLLEVKLKPYADRIVVIAAGAVAFTSVRLALGVVRAACGDLDGAVRDLTAAYRLHREAEPAFAVWCAEELARVLQERGRSDDLTVCRELLSEALPVARSLGMHAHLPRLEALAEACSAPDAQRHADDEDRVTLLISDVAASTRLTETLGEGAVHALLGEHRRAVTTTALEEGGLVLKVMGDGVLVAFSSADAALRCAARLQQRFEQPASAVRVRIGVHTGPVLRQGDSMYGRTMILAFRIADQAAAGEVLVSCTTRAAARTDLDFEEPKRLPLKGIEQPQEVFSLRWRTERRQD